MHLASHRTAVTRAKGLLRSFLTAGLVLLLYTPGLVAQTDLEYRVKAAFLFNFARFVEWPDEAFDNADSMLRLCVLDPDPFGAALRRTIAGKRIDGHALSLQRKNRLADIDECHILFVGTRAPHSLSAVLDALKGRPVLTVGEGVDFVQAGGMIGFVIEQGKVRFQINLPAAEAADLKVSSKLLSVASRVRGGGG